MKAYEMFKKLVNNAEHIFIRCEEEEAHTTMSEIIDCDDAYYCPGYYDGEFSPIGNSPASILAFTRASIDDIENVYINVRNNEFILGVDVSPKLWGTLIELGITWNTCEE